MNIELSIYKIKNLAYSYAGISGVFIALILKLKFNYSAAEYITVAVLSSAVLLLPLWLEARKLKKHFKEN